MGCGANNGANYKRVTEIKSVTLLFSVSGKRGSNPRPSAWEADALPLSYSRLCLATILMGQK